MFYVSVYAGLVLSRILAGTAQARRIVYWLALGFLFVFSAFRFEVGCDWIGYLLQYWWAQQEVVNPDFISREPAWWAVVNLVVQSGLSYPWLNVISSAAFFFGVHRLARKQPDALAFLVLLFPVLVINMPMSGIRQGVAIGVMCIAFNAFRDNRLIRYTALTLFASLFHASAVLFLALAPFVGRNPGRVRMLIALALAAVAVVYIARSPVAEFAAGRYGGAGADEAQGAPFRVGFLAASGLLYLLVLRTKWPLKSESEARLATLLSLMMVAIVALLPFSSVIADRLGYYLIPVQAMIFARIPFLPLAGLRLPLAVAPYAANAILLTAWVLLSGLFRGCYEPYQTWIFGYPDTMKFPL